MDREPAVFRAIVLKLFLAVTFFLYEIFFDDRVNASGRVDKNRGISETGS